LPDYEAKLIESLGRQPSELGLVMISRILNTGAYVIGQQPVQAILEQVLNNGKTTPALRKQAEEIEARVNNLR
jgi:hypothetical protein